jgi:hypothetical protein
MNLEGLIENCRNRQSIDDVTAFESGIMASRSLRLDYEVLTPEALYKHDRLRQANDGSLYRLGVGDMQLEDGLVVRKNNDAIRRGGK